MTAEAKEASGPGRGGRMSRQRKRDAVLRLLRGEDLEMVSRSLGVTAATLAAWRDAFLAGGEARLATRPTDGEALESERLKARLGETLLERELLEAKIAALAGGRPCMGRSEASGFHSPLHEERLSWRCGGRSEAELSRTSKRAEATRPHDLVFGGPAARTMMHRAHRERGSERAGPVFGSGRCPRAKQRCTAPSDRRRSRRLGWRRAPDLVRG